MTKGMSVIFLLADDQTLNASLPQSINGNLLLTKVQTAVFSLLVFVGSYEHSVVQTIKSGLIGRVSQRVQGETLQVFGLNN